MRLDFLDEPELEFGSGRHVDIRFGLMNFGPLDINQSTSPKSIRVGVVGTAETIEGITSWIDRCRTEIGAKKSDRNNLFPRFPGFSQPTGLGSEVAIESRGVREIRFPDLNSLIEKRHDRAALSEIVDTFLSELAFTVENTNADVLICAPPYQLDRGTLKPDNPAQNSRSQRIPHREKNFPTFHDLLKARSMPLKRPLQLVFPATYGGKVHHGGTGHRGLQDEATRAWNFYTALYYKAGGRPWRLVRDSEELTTCFIGVSFYESVDQSNIRTSIAQIFNERGHGIVVRGASVARSTEDRQPHLNSHDAEGLVSSALAKYRAEHRNLPARVVIHKTSRFNSEEREGFESAVEKFGIDCIILTSVKHSDTRLFRSGEYPPLRGTIMTSEGGPHFLCSRGSINFYSTYPGMYVPVPLEFRIESGEQTPKSAALELMELTKMNWNSTQFDGGEPITLRAAKQVGFILKHVEEGSPIENRYSSYM